MIHNVDLMALPSVTKQVKHIQHPPPLLLPPLLVVMMGSVAEDRVTIHVGRRELGGVPTLPKILPLAPHAGVGCRIFTGDSGYKPLLLRCEGCGQVGGAPNRQL